MGSRDSNIIEYVIQSVLENRVEETKVSYPDSRSVRDSRNGGPNESEEVVDGVSVGGPKLLVGAPLPKHLGHVVGYLWGTSSVLGSI